MLEFRDIENNFTNEEKLNSFLYLQNYIIDKLNNKEKFFIGRLSGNEPCLCGHKLKNYNIPNNLLYEMQYTAGIKFNSHDDIKEYVKQYIKSCKNSNILCIWSGIMYKQGEILYNFLKKCTKNQKYICAQALEPYYYMNNNNYKLNEIFKNKKILIVNSHINTINSQISNNNYKKLFIKPLFDDSTKIKIYKPSQQNAGNNDVNNWIYHIEKMKSDINELNKNYNFDIALLSCGGFGMLLSDYIYTKLNKSVIYVGGSLQLFFGIIGNRWRNHPIISKLFNNYWTNVLESDKPKSLNNNPKLCENSCYW